MVAWDRADSTVITAVSNYLLKVWNTVSGQLLHVLSVSGWSAAPSGKKMKQNSCSWQTDHTGTVSVQGSRWWGVCDGSPPIWFPYHAIRRPRWQHLHLGPVQRSQDPQLLQHGNWIDDVNHSAVVFLYTLQSLNENICFQIEGQGHGAIFDCKFSADGQHFACTDSHGHLLIFGFGCSRPYEKVTVRMYIFYIISTFLRIKHQDWIDLALILYLWFKLTLTVDPL